MKAPSTTANNLLNGNLAPTLAMLAVFSIIGWTLSVGAPVQKAAAGMPPELDAPCLSGETQQSAPRQFTRKKRAPRNLAIFIFDGVQIIDYTGPFEVLGEARTGSQPLFNIYTVAAKPGLITTNMGMAVNPKYTFDNMPKADVPILPDSAMPRNLNNPAVSKWVQGTSGEAAYVMSVCNRVFFPGRAGLLVGQ